MKSKVIRLSGLGHTWIFDLDGTIFEHNLYLKGRDRAIPSFLKFYQKIPPRDAIILVTARQPRFRAQTLRFLKKYKIRYDSIIFGLPRGERILFNDIKPSGLRTALHFNVKRNKFPNFSLKFKAPLKPR